MANEPQANESVRKIVEAIVAQAVARCRRQGITLENFYVAMLAEQDLHPKGDLTELFDQVFRRLGGNSN